MTGINGLKFTGRVLASGQRGFPLTLEDLEQFCRTARAEGTLGHAQVVVTNSHGTGNLTEIFADRHVEAEPEPIAARIPEAVMSASVEIGHPVGRYIGLAGDVPVPARSL